MFCMVQYLLHQRRKTLQGAVAVARLADRTSLIQIQSPRARVVTSQDPSAVLESRDACGAAESVQRHDGQIHPTLQGGRERGVQNPFSSG